MNRMLLLAIAATLAGCAPLSAMTGAPGQTNNAEVLKAIGNHLDGCERHYQGSLGLGANFTFSIDCPVQPASPPPAA